MGTAPASDPDSDLAPRVVNAQTAGRLLGISRTTLWELSRRGELPCLHIGRSVRWALADIDAFIARMRSEQQLHARQPGAGCQMRQQAASGSAPGSALRVGDHHRNGA